MTGLRKPELAPGCERLSRRRATHESWSGRDGWCDEVGCRSATWPEACAGFPALKGRATQRTPLCGTKCVSREFQGLEIDNGKHGLGNGPEPQSGDQNVAGVVVMDSHASQSDDQNVARPFKAGLGTAASPCVAGRRSKRPGGGVEGGVVGCRSATRTEACAGFPALKGRAT
jgi:hypothetical protein